MSVSFFAGVDGGGTRTSVICRTAEGVLIGQKTFGPFNLNGIGKDAFCLLLDQIIEYLKSLGTCLGVCIGASGVDNSLLQDIAKDAFSKAGIKLRLLSDYEIAHAGAFGGEEGIIAISGTGSVCYGRTRDGRCARSGGWGHLIGDGGSAYGLGRDALCAVARDIDGCSEHTVLTSMLSERKGLVDQNTIISYVYSNDKRAVSSLSPIVEEACSAGDPVAMRILEDNAKDLVSDVLAVSDRLALTRCRIVLLGGLLENDTCFRKCFIRLLGQSRPTLEVVEPLHNAAEGALLEAKVSGR